MSRVQFSTGQQRQLRAGTVKAEDKVAQSTALYNTGIQKATDDAIYKIFGERLKNIAKQVEREYTSRTGLADTIAKGVQTVAPTVVDYVIPGASTAVRALTSTAISEGTRYAAGGYKGADTGRLTSLGMPKTLFKTKSVGAPLLDSRDDIVEGLEDAAQARRINLAVGAVIDTVRTGMESEAYMSTTVEGSPLSNRQLLMPEEGQQKIGFGDYFAQRNIANVPSEKFFEFSLEQYVKKNPNATQQDKNQFLRRIYNIYPNLAIEKGYNVFEDMQSLYQGQGDEG